jgi:FixJ family two-component response regulator
VAGRRLAAIILSEAEHEELTSLARRGKTAQAIAMRARIILACAAGEQNKDIAAGLKVHPMTVGKWREGSCCTVWTGCATNPAPVRPARLMMRGSRR